jgi:phage I-like protein
MKSTSPIRLNGAARLGLALNSADKGREPATISIALNAQNGTVPEWVELIPPGPIVKGRDRRMWQMEDSQRVVDASNAWAKANGAPLDVEHATQIKAPQGEPAPACGWFAEYRVAANGAIEARVEWTDLGKGYVERREYRFISVAFDYDLGSYEILMIVGGGLTNRKNLSVAALNSETENKEKAMDKELLKALDLPETATTAQALNAIQQLKTDRATALNAAQTPPLDKFVPRADYDTALNRADSAEEKIKEGEANALKADVQTAINAAVEGGKIAPANKGWYEETLTTREALNGFQKMVAAAPKVVAETPAAGGETPEIATALNQSDKAVAAQMGISEDDVKKYGN